jgi:hypothetical protein
MTRTAVHQPRSGEHDEDLTSRRLLAGAVAVPQATAVPPRSWAHPPKGQPVKPDEELLGIVVHSGLVLASDKGVVAALRRITAFPAGLSLDAVVLARDVHAEAATRREHQATAQRAAEAGAQEDDDDVVRWEREAAAPPDHLHKQATIEPPHLPRFGRGDELRLAVLTRGDEPQSLHPYQASSSGNDTHYRFEASYWAAPLPVHGLLTLVCAWPEVGLGETVTDILLPDLALRAAGARSLWELAQGT